MLLSSLKSPSYKFRIGIIAVEGFAFAVMDGTAAGLISIFLAILFYVLNKVKKRYSYFEEQGIPYVPATFPFGSDIKSSILLHNIGLDKIYYTLKSHNVGGYYQYLNQVYMVTNPEYIHKIFVSDFSYFQDRGIKIDEKLNPLDGNLFFLSGQKWRYLRQKLSPIFSSGKLRWMYDEMHKCGDTFIKHFERHVGKDVDIQDDMGCFTTDVIGSTAFGLKIDSIKNPDSEFRKMGKKVFELSFLSGSRIFGRLNFPKILSLLNIRTINSSVDRFFTSMIKQALDHRIKSGAQRKDIVQLLLELKQKGSVTLEPKDTSELQDVESIQGNDALKKLELTDEVLAAQSFVFFVAGFETTATALHYSLYFLSKYPACQDKAREEIRLCKKKYGDKIEYDTLKDLKYLENCISETLRIFPPITQLFRECNKNYTFPNGMKLPKGSFVVVPIYSLHNDPEYFPDPKVFNPDRFDHDLIPGTYAPFGEGPRICIGKRFALTEVKMALAKILDVYLLEKSDRTIEPIEFASTSFLAFPKNGIFVKVKKL